MIRQPSLLRPAICATKSGNCKLSPSIKEIGFSMPTNNQCGPRCAGMT
jgi:hypothetical protein